MGKKEQIFFEDLVPDNFPRMIKETDPEKTQEAAGVQNEINLHRCSSRHLINKRAK